MAALVNRSLCIKSSHFLPVAYVSVTKYSTDVQPLRDARLSALKRGRGGRSSFNGIVAAVFGSSGFLGRYVANQLGKIGTQLILPYRCDYYDMRRLALVGDVGQVLFVPMDLRDEASLRKAMKYANVVVNLIGRDWETKRYTYDDVHCHGARRLARVAREMGIPKFIHLSALNATQEDEGKMIPGGSKYLQSKRKGEEAVLEEFPDATIIRPATMFGQEDRFLRQYAHFFRRNLFHGVPLWNKGEGIIKQPVYVRDVARGVVSCVKERDDIAGKIYEAVGPHRYELGEMVDWIYRVMRKGKEWGYYRYDLKYAPLFRTRISLMERLPGWPVAQLTWDKLEREHLTDVLTGKPTLEDLGVELTPLRDMIEWELKPYFALSYVEVELGHYPPPKPAPIVA